MAAVIDALRDSWKSRTDKYGRLLGLGAIHALADRSTFEQQLGVSLCRRCGWLIEWDERPDLATAQTASCPGVAAWSWPAPNGRVQVEQVAS